MERMEAIEMLEVHVRSIEEEMQRRGRYVLLDDVWIDKLIIGQLRGAIDCLMEADDETGADEG